jgi:hypothetical protein
MVFIFGHDLVNSGMESGGKSKLPLNCAGDGKGVGRTPLALRQLACLLRSKGLSGRSGAGEKIKRNVLTSGVFYPAGKWFPGRLE